MLLLIVDHTRLTTRSDSKRVIHRVSITAQTEVRPICLPCARCLPYSPKSGGAIKTPQTNILRRLRRLFRKKKLDRM